LKNFPAKDIIQLIYYGPLDKQVVLLCFIIIFGKLINGGNTMAYQPRDDRYDAMKYNRCGKSGLKLPAISLGLWHNFGGEDFFENGRAIIRRAFDLGITHFDLANN
jgi:hypothetical protein